MKSIRQQILRALNVRGESTVEELIDQIDGFTRKQVSDNMQAVVQDKLATRRKDASTGMPAYVITELGVARIKDASEPMPMPVPPMPVLINEFSEIQYLRDSLRERDAEITRLIEQLAMRDTPSTAEPIEFTHYQTDDNQKLSTLEDAINYAADLNKPMIVYGAVEVGLFELVTISRWVPLSA